VLSRTLASVSSLSSRERLDQRYEKFRNMGRLGLEFADESAR
jgi:acetyl-CoA carboxylase alpha subunit